MTETQMDQQPSDFMERCIAEHKERHRDLMLRLKLCEYHDKEKQKRKRIVLGVSIVMSIISLVSFFYLNGV